MNEHANSSLGDEMVSSTSTYVPPTKEELQGRIWRHMITYSKVRWWQWEYKKSILKNVKEMCNEWIELSEK